MQRVVRAHHIAVRGALRLLLNRFCRVVDTALLFDRGTVADGNVPFFNALFPVRIVRLSNHFSHRAGSCQAFKGVTRLQRLSGL